MLGTWGICVVNIKDGNFLPCFTRCQFAYGNVPPSPAPFYFVGKSAYDILLLFFCHFSPLLGGVLICWVVPDMVVILLISTYNTWFSLNIDNHLVISHGDCLGEMSRSHSRNESYRCWPIDLVRFVMFTRLQFSTDCSDCCLIYYCKNFLRHCKHNEI